MDAAMMMIGFCILSIVLILLIAHNHADINLILCKLNNEHHSKSGSRLEDLLEKYEGQDVILAQKIFVSETCMVSEYYYADSKGSPLYFLDENQNYYMSSNCGRVYWNPRQKDLMSDDWHFVRKGTPFGFNECDLGTGLAVLRERDIEEVKGYDNSDSI